MEQLCYCHWFEAALTELNGIWIVERGVKRAAYRLYCIGCDVVAEICSKDPATCNSEAVVSRSSSSEAGAYHGFDLSTSEIMGTVSTAWLRSWLHI